MAICVNTSSVEYQSLKNKAGVPEPFLKAICSKYLTEHNRLPRLDEISGSNSKGYLSKSLNISKNNSTKIDNILKFTNTSSVEEAVVNLNTEYPDSETLILPIVEDAIVDIQQRPTTEYKESEQIFEPDEKPAMDLIIKLQLDKLRNLYGIKVNEVNDRILSEMTDLIPEDKIVNGFIYNGEIYINTDKASADTLIHEMLHLLVGSLRFTNPQLYTQLINLAKLLKGYSNLVSRLSKNRTRNDINEEIFILELAKYLSGMHSQFNSLDSELLYEINYNVNRVLDSMLMGDVSTKSISKNRLYNMSLKDVVKEVNSSLLTGKAKGFLADSEVHRTLNNKKSDLKEKGLLKEICG